MTAEADGMLVLLIGMAQITAFAYVVGENGLGRSVEDGLVAMLVLGVVFIATFAIGEVFTPRHQ